MAAEKKSVKISIEQNGPYIVKGNIPLVRKIQIVSEYGEPLTWQKEGNIEAEESYQLCRCGKSSMMPFCDGTHHRINFDGTETCEIKKTSERQTAFPGGTQIVVKYDPYLCMDSGYCCTRSQCIGDLVMDTDDPQVRAQVMHMIENCPSGSYTYSIEENSPDIEPDLPRQIAVTTEITSDGPIEGPLWVTGNIPVERSDGEPMEVRNRVTLCSCGRSKTKPLCDGTHRTSHPRMIK